MVDLSFLRLGGAQPVWSGQAEPVEQRRAAALSSTRNGLLTLGAFGVVAGLWLLTHIYQGVLLDSRVYIGRAMADLAPATIGRDLMFAHDGQAKFSIFTLLTRSLVAAFGPQRAATLLAMTGTGLWFAAATAFFTRIAKGRLAWAMLACLAVLPSTYGGLSIIPFGEALATPRPFAEAGVLAALTFALDGRRPVASALLIAAGLFHPLMALCGFGVFFVLIGWEDRRWIAPAAGLAGLAVIAGALGAPIAARLFQRVDPDWLALLRLRNPYLFPGLWPLSTWSQSVLQVTTTVIAALLLRGRARILFAAAASVAVAMVAASWLLGDVWPNLLMLQVQPWRALWITAVFGAAGVGLCGVKLWQGGPASQIALAALAVGWLAPDSPAALIASPLALILFGLDRFGKGVGIGQSVVYTAWALAALLGAIQVWRIAAFGLQAVAAMPPSAYADAFLIALHLEAVVIVPLAIWAASVRPERWTRIATWLLPALGAALFAFGALRWDRAPADPSPDLARLMAGRPGAVEWIDGDVQAWSLAGRANWASEIQGASIVFSREQAMAWRSRMRLMLQLHLVGPHILDPFAQVEGYVTRPTGAALNALCRTPDGPAWIVSPVIEGEPPPNAPHTQIWRPERPGYIYGGQFRWLKIAAYAVTRCDRS